MEHSGNTAQPVKSGDLMRSRRVNVVVVISHLRKVSGQKNTALFLSNQETNAGGEYVIIRWIANRFIYSR